MDTVPSVAPRVEKGGKIAIDWPENGDNATLPRCNRMKSRSNYANYDTRQWPTSEFHE